MDVPINEHRILHYFNKKRVKEYCQKFGWTEITSGNCKQLFLDFCSEMQMFYSYKSVLLISFICKAFPGTCGYLVHAYYGACHNVVLDCLKTVFGCHHKSSVLSLFFIIFDFF